MNRIYSQVIDEGIYQTELNNGLAVAMLPRSDFNRQYALLSVNCGSIDICFKDPVSGDKVEVPAGIAHFLEHKLFEDKEESIFDKFAALGSSTNAYTGFTKTSYIFSSTGQFTNSLQNLLDFVQTPQFTPESIEREKLIIAREIEMYEDQPDWQCFFNLLRALYHKFPVIYDIAGTVASIQDIDREYLDIFYSAFYHPHNMVLFITGDFNPDQILRLIELNQNKKDFTDLQGAQRCYPDEPEECNQWKIEKIMDIPKPIINIGFKEKTGFENGRTLIKNELLTTMLLELLLGKSSIMYERLYERGLIDNSFSANYTANHNFSFVNIGGRTNDPELLAAELPQILKTAAQQLQKKDFERIKRKYRGEFISGFNSFEMVGSEFVDLYFKGLNLFEKFSIMESIGFEELHEHYDSLFTPEKMSISIINNL